VDGVVVGVWGYCWTIWRYIRWSLVGCLGRRLLLGLCKAEEELTEVPRIFDIRRRSHDADHEKSSENF
jgi:hypothetical protein